jgi:predicted DNA binding CopG/RHH family protein
MTDSKLSELRRHFDATDLSQSIQDAELDDRILAPDEVMVSTSIRLPRSLMQQVRARAAEAGIPATTLIRQWVIDRLRTHESEAVVSVADLQRLIAERSHPAA